MVYQLTPYCDVQKILLLVVGTKLNIISQLVSEYDLYLCQITLWCGCRKWWLDAREMISGTSPNHVSVPAHVKGATPQGPIRVLKALAQVTDEHLDDEGGIWFGMKSGARR